MVSTILVDGSDGPGLCGKFVSLASHVFHDRVIVLKSLPQTLRLAVLIRTVYGQGTIKDKADTLVSACKDLDIFLAGPR